MNRYRIALAAAVCCALSLYFMDSETEQQLAAVTKIATEKTNRADIQETISSTAESVPSAEEEKVDAEKVLKLAFDPPFPERTNLFQAPKRHGRGGAKSKGQSETSVELLGFVNVNGQRVALSIDGLVTTVAEGGQAYGIEVISIQPPSVFLRRGKQRWQASFEN